MMNIFDNYLAQYACMTKAQIVAVMVSMGFCADNPAAIAAKLKWKKVMLARDLADRMTRKELRGY